MIHENFKSYFMQNFFSHDEKEAEEFFSSISKPLRRSIRVNTRKTTAEKLSKVLLEKGFELEGTFQENVFYVERGEEFNDKEKRLGFSIEHLLGQFYIQELGASSSVYFLADGQIDDRPLLILDMASSPGGKTTQLSEYFPNGFIVANEFEKKRIPQLLTNIERMGCENIGVTNYNGQFIGRLSDTFDKVILDAPCSGEGIGFKSSENLRYWNLRNIRKISQLQEKLLEAGLNALKIGGDLLYSTCTMNKIENEGVVEKIFSKHPGCFEKTFEKRFWPHKDATGGFFVCRIRKLRSLDYRFTQKEEKWNEGIRNLKPSEKAALDRFIAEKGVQIGGDTRFLIYENEVLKVGGSSYPQIAERLYFFRLGRRIGSIRNGEFIPSYHFGRDYLFESARRYEIRDDEELDRYLRGFEITHHGGEGLVQITFRGDILGIGQSDRDGRIGNEFPRGWLRK